METADPFTTPLPLAEPPAPLAKAAAKPRAARVPKAQAPAAGAADPSEDPPWDVEEGEAPAQASADPTEAARDLTTIKTQLGTYDKIEAGLQELEAKFKDVVYPVETEVGMSDAKAALKAIRDPRFKLENARKAAKRPIIDLGKLIDSRAKAISTRLVALEAPIDQQVTAQEAIEAERIAEIHRVINWLRDLPAQMVGKSLAQLSECLQQLGQLDVATFAEFEKDGLDALAAALRQVQALHDAASRAEEERQQQRREQAERERRAALNDRIDEIASNVALGALARDTAKLQKLRAAVATKALTADEFAELLPQARQVHRETLERLDAMLADRLEREQLAEHNARLQRELEQLRAQLAPPPAPVAVPEPQADWPVIEEPAPLAQAPQAPQLQDPVHAEVAVDPATTPTSFGLMPDGPTDVEIVTFLAEHYDDHPLNVLIWLAAMDIEALTQHFKQPA